jgi:hypothetical protein
MQTAPSRVSSHLLSLKAFMYRLHLSIPLLPSHFRHLRLRSQLLDQRQFQTTHPRLRPRRKGMRYRLPQLPLHLLCLAERRFPLGDCLCVGMSSYWR